ncbi:MAG: FtsW/RodA/SpoVE family cell cycle protein [Sphingomonadales bacterium]|nr:FtsW/RodA/SpoVE family cell cycle protein [Sphingomonadales bacterium]
MTMIEQFADLSLVATSDNGFVDHLGGVYGKAVAEKILAAFSEVDGVSTIAEPDDFARVAADLAYRLPRIELSVAQTAYPPELVNRFYDVVTLQKVTAQLLTDGVGIVLATLVGMIVLAFYHPWLLGFDVLLLGLLALGLYRLVVSTDELMVKIAAAGVFAWVLFQALVNISVVLGLLPAKGITLPFCQLWEAPRC